MIDYLKSVMDKTIISEYAGRNAGYDVWNWVQGVGMYSILKANEVVKEDTYFNFVKGWVDYHINRGLPPININTTIPMVTVLEIYKVTGDIQYKNLCQQYADYCMAEAPRVDEGAFEHTVLEDNWKNQIWADTLYMGAMFLARWGQFTGKDMYIKEAARQMVLHYKYLIDDETGLMFHGYNCTERNHMSSVRWGRANGWGIISSLEILEVMPLYFSERDKIVNSFVRHLNSLITYQCESGMWRTVLNDSSSYEEATITAAMIYGIYEAIKQGYVSKDMEKHANKALEAIIASINTEGTVLKTSGPTPVMATAKEYNEIPCMISYYGQGLAMYGLLAAIKYKRYE